MTKLVVDASLAAQWLLPDEQADLAQAEIVNEFGISIEAIAPGLFPFELSNVVVKATRLNRISVEDASNLIAYLGKLQIRLVDSLALSETFALAVAHRLSYYDAAYLHLAITEGATLATADAALVRAAQALNVPLLFGRA